MIIKIDETVQIELIEEKHAQSIFTLVNNNRNHLRQWLPFVDKMQTVEFALNFVKGSIQRNNEGNEFAFVVFNDHVMVGRIGVYKIDHQNKIGEIGYWIIEKAQGRGIITKSCKALIDFCFTHLQLNRIEIKCGTDNIKSQKIPERLNFKHEGTIRQGELLNEQFIDLNLYTLLKKEHQN